MIPNPDARPLVEFIRSKGLSVRTVAKCAGINESVIRSYKDDPHRKITEGTRISIAKALRLLTLERIDIVWLFGFPEDCAHDAEINIDRNIVFTYILRAKELTPAEASRRIGVPFDVIVALLMNKEIDNGNADKIKYYFRTDEIVDRDQFSFERLYAAPGVDVGNAIGIEWPGEDMGGDDLEEIKRGISRADLWWQRLVELAGVKNRSGIAQLLGEGVPVLWLTARQLAGVESIIKYLRETRQREDQDRSGD